MNSYLRVVVVRVRDVVDDDVPSSSTLPIIVVVDWFRCPFFFFMKDDSNNDSNGGGVPTPFILCVFERVDRVELYCMVRRD